jgi:hypothetical protein
LRGRGLPPKSGRKSRPTSGKSNKSFKGEGKYAQMARDSSRNGSKERRTPLGKYASMGQGNMEEDEVNALSTKFGASPMVNRDFDDRKEEGQRKSILRPFSGKSNS